MPLSALLLVVVAAFIHAWWNLLMKRAGAGGLVFVWGITAATAVVFAVPVFALMREDLAAIDAPIFAAVLVSAAVHTLYLWVLQRGYAAGDLSVVYPVARGVGPALASIGAIVWLGEAANFASLGGLALIVAGPDKPVSQEETDLILAYLKTGGSLIYLSEPAIVTQFGDAPDPLAAAIKDNFGVQLSNDMVIDLNYNPPSVAVSASYGQHAITQKMNNLAVVMPSARSVEPVATPPSGVTDTVLVQTAQNSWAETDMKSLSENKVNFDSGVDLQGPVSLAVAAENSTTGARVVVIGDSDFASSNNFTQYGNGDFLINSIDWAAKQENLINLTPKQTTQRILVMRDQSTMGLILFGTVFLIPGIVIISGVAVWIQRRRRG